MYNTPYSDNHLPYSPIGIFLAGVTSSMNTLFKFFSTGTPIPTATSRPKKPGGSRSSSDSAPTKVIIIGCVAGGVCLLVVIALGIVCYCCAKHCRPSDAEQGKGTNSSGYCLSDGLMSKEVGYVENHFSDEKPPVPAAMDEGGGMRDGKLPAETKPKAKKPTVTSGCRNGSVSQPSLSKKTSGKSETKQISGQSKQTSGQSKQTSGQSEQTSGQSKQTFRQSKQMSEQSKQTSGQSKQTSGQSKQTPGQRKQTSGQSKQTSGQSKQTSGQSKQTSGQSKQTSGQSKQSSGPNKQRVGSISSPVRSAPPPPSSSKNQVVPSTDRNPAQHAPMHPPTKKTNSTAKSAPRRDNIGDFGYA